MTPSTVTPAPGAVCPAIVMYGFVIRMFPRMTPLTSNTTIRGPSAAHAAARLPAPEALRLVTLMTFPPRPPVLAAPHPSAPGKAFSSLPALASPVAGTPVVTAKRQPQVAAHADRVLIIDSLLDASGGFAFELPRLPRRRGRSTWVCPVRAALADELVVQQVRVGPADAVDLGGLAGTEGLRRVEAPDAVQKPLPTENLVNPGD